MFLPIELGGKNIVSPIPMYMAGCPSEQTRRVDHPSAVASDTVSLIFA